MSHIFVSYSKKNRDYVRLFADKLIELGFDVWIDDRIDYGEDWELAIFRAIDECGAFVIVMTPESYESQWVRRECQHAEKRNKPSFPLLLGGEEFPRYAITQYHDVRDGQLPPADYYDMLATYVARKASQGVEIARVKLGGRLATGELEAAPQVSPVNTKLPDVMSLLPGPFAWCVIPSGSTRIDDASHDGGTAGGRYAVETFVIAQYPVTTAQYRVFIDSADGYRALRWWDYSDDAHDWRKNNAQPTATIAADAQLPCSNLAWYDAMAFCRWLSWKLQLFPYPSLNDSSEKTGWGIKLPSEQQWQRAAQGDEANSYPWGNTFDPARCNAKESGTGGLTPVDHYTNGASPYGVMDMSGNVWEWCLTEWGTDSLQAAGHRSRVMRGGSWVFSSDQVRITYRGWGGSPDQLGNVGFRVALY